MTTSPCIRVCTLDPDGALRGLWPHARGDHPLVSHPEEERQLIMAELPERMRQAFALESPFAPEPDKAE